MSSGQYKMHHGWKSRRWIVRDGMAVLLAKDGREILRKPIEKKSKK